MQHKFLKYVVYAVYNVVAVLVLTEVSLRYIYTPNPLLARLEANRFASNHEQSQASLWEHNNLRFTPNSHGRILHAEYDVPVTHDQFGFRNTCFRIEDKINHVLIGDSFVYGIGVGDEDSLGCRLNRASNRKGIYTIGVPGAHPKSYIALLKQHKHTLSEHFSEHVTVSFVFFLGNDYETLLSLASRTHNMDITPAPAPAPAPATPPTKNTLSVPEAKRGAWDFQIWLKSMIKNINTSLTKNKHLNQIYVVQAIKLIAVEVLDVKDHGEYVTNNGGITFYKKSVKHHTQSMVRSFEYIREFLSGHGLALGAFIFIPDPAELGPDRLRRDMSIAGIDPKIINPSFKIETLKNACDQLALRCVDLAEALSVDDYYHYDNHLRKEGVANAAAHIHENMQRW